MAAWGAICFSDCGPLDGPLVPSSLHTILHESSQSSILGLYDSALPKSNVLLVDSTMPSPNDYTYKSSGTNSQGEPERAKHKQAEVDTCDWNEHDRLCRVTTTVLETTDLTLPTRTRTITRTVSLTGSPVVLACLDDVFHLRPPENGSYYYNNANGSTYYNDGRGGSTYNPPNGGNGGQCGGK